MKTQTFHLELITPCFCGGAEPERQAEIRAPSIRGQLRWWFRTLGGFKALGNGVPVREQEAIIFGSASGDRGTAGKLLVRVRVPHPQSNPVGADDVGARMNTPLGYALFPLRQTSDNNGRRGMIPEGTILELSVVWRGAESVWNSIRALVAVWAHLGALGFRSRRTFGGLRLASPEVALPAALDVFSALSNITVKELDGIAVNGWRTASAELLKWYRSWRQHGQCNRTWVWNDSQNRRMGGRWEPIPAERRRQFRIQPGFRYARRDHNEGLEVQGTGAPRSDPENPAGQPGETFRPALGLPIIQFFSSLGGNDGPTPRKKATVNWDESWNLEKDKGEGRFASPVLLRPHRDVQGNWHALVIFLDGHKWPQGKQVFLNGEPRAVSLDLYEAMKKDEALKRFTG
jgi:CRISPR-associated protein Cmr1